MGFGGSAFEEMGVIEGKVQFRFAIWLKLSFCLR